MLNNIVGILAPQVPIVLNSYESISTTTLGSTQASITISSIPSTYKHLQVRIIGRSDRAVALDALYIYLNGDTTQANYYQHGLLGDGAATPTGFNASTNFMAMTVIPAASAGASMFGAIVADVLDYSDGNKYKTSRAIGGSDQNGSGQVRLTSGLWKSTAVVNSLTITTNGGGSLVSGTQVALYGIKG